MTRRQGNVVPKLVRLFSVALLLMVALALSSRATPTGFAQGSTFCAPGETPQFRLGFAALKAQLGAAAGDPLECEHYDGQGNAYQKTTTGQMVWNKATNTATFTPTGMPPAGSTIVQVPVGYGIEKVVGGLTYATSVVWDDQGRMYVVEGGGQFLEEPPPPRILRVENGQATEVVNLADKGIADTVGGIAWHNGAFYITHRDADRAGAVSRVTLDGTVTPLFGGILDSQSEHQVNDIAVGPDGRMYVASGPAANSGVVGLDLGPFVERSPMVHTSACADIVLTGVNFMTPDFRTPDQSDTTMTGAFVPFGTMTTPGQRIAGTNKCGGAILVFDLDDPAGTLEPYAWGFRNIIGFDWNSAGEMFAGVNGFDVRGSRPVNDQYDATYRVRAGTWYGWPDFSAALEPVTDPKFDVPDSLQAPMVIAGQPQPDRALRFVIDHAASGLARPDRALVYGLHELNSSPSKIAFAPAGWGTFGGQLFVAEWGDLAPGTTPLRNEPTGYQVTRIDPATGRAVPFAYNAMPGAASSQNAPGLGLERPLDVKFGPDGAMYIVDFGTARVNPARVAQGQVPYEFPPQTGSVWRVTPTSGGPAPTAPAAPPAPAPTAPAPTSDVSSAMAEMRDVQGRVVGMATFTQGDDGMVEVEVEVSGFNPVAGAHGIHVHEVGICEPPFESAGEHVNPTGAQHGFNNPNGPYMGDLPNIDFLADGSASYRAMTDRFTLGSLFDANGSALLIHASPDDYQTDPAGNSGDRIGCGVIVAAP